MQDDFGHDPRVRAMRGVFRAVEEAQARLLADLGLGRFDPRLRAWREDALWRFEKAWPRAAQRGLAGGEEGAAALYLHALAAAMTADGLAVPEAVWRPDPELDRVAREAWS